MSTSEQEKVEAGFELDGRYYPWRISDTGKDLLLIDRFSGLPVNEFFDLIGDETQRTRAPVILAMIATSVRAGNPAWSVERIVKLVQDVSLSTIEMITGDVEDEELPPAEAGVEPATSTSPAAESSPLSIPEENSLSEMSYVTHP